MKDIVFDCDNTFGLNAKEIDDGLALLYLLGRRDLSLHGVTTVFGNGTMKESFQQTKGLLESVGCSEIPVYQGASEPGWKPTDAAQFLADVVKDKKGGITILATGPLSNLFAASKIDPHFFQYISEIVCMGGCTHPLRIGWRTLDELNISADTEASWSVLNADCKVTLMNAHLCQKVYFDWNDFKTISHWPQEIKRKIRNWLLLFGLYCGKLKFYLWDLVPAVYLSFPEVFSQNVISVLSSRQDLEIGHVTTIDTSSGPEINMPDSINNGPFLKRTIFNAWENTINRWRKRE